MRQSPVADSEMRMFAERYSLPHFLFSRQTTITVNLCHEVRPSILSLERPEFTAYIPSNTVLSHAEKRRLSSRFSELRSKSKRELERTQMVHGCYCI